LSETDHPSDGRSNRDPADRFEGAWTDPEILEGVRRRDSQALGAFFDTAFPYVYNLAFRLTGHREIAEDVTQDVFIKVHQAADRLQVDRHPKPWLTTITYNTVRDAARRSAVRPEVAENGRITGERHGESTNPEEELLRKEREKLTESALLKLDEESRAVIILHDFCDTNHEEIAEMMGLSHAAVRKRYSRSLKRMAQIIKGLQE
jgi:RNA polymerase sigma-70 factor (ECF subfamily)